MVKATFIRGDREAQADFWMIPDRKTLKTLASREFETHA